MTRAQVRAQQRGRLLSAMVETTGSEGFNATPVAAVIARAGVSRKTFYEIFDDRRACLMAAQQQVAAAALHTAEQAAEAAGSREQRLAQAIAALSRSAHEHPAACRIALREIAAAGADGLAQRQRTADAAAALLARQLGAQAPSAPLLQMILGGILHTVQAHSYQRNAAADAAAAAQLASWASCYQPVPAALAAAAKAAAREGRRTAPAGTLGGRAPGTLSLSARRLHAAGPPASARFTAHSQHERILDAIAQLLTEREYALLTVDDVAAVAGVSPNSIYARFRDKHDAFLVAHDVGQARVLGLIERAISDAADWPAGVRAGVEALTRFLAGEPAFANLALVQAATATPVSAERAGRYAQVTAQLLLERRPGGAPAAARNGRRRTATAAGADGNGAQATAILDEAIGGGIAEALFQMAAAGRIERATELVAPITYFVLAPHIGRAAAARAAARGGGE